MVGPADHESQKAEIKSLSTLFVALGSHTQARPDIGAMLAPYDAVESTDFKVIQNLLVAFVAMRTIGDALEARRAIDGSISPAGVQLKATLNKNVWANFAHRHKIDTNACAPTVWVGYGTCVPPGTRFADVQGALQREFAKYAAVERVEGDLRGGPNAWVTFQAPVWAAIARMLADGARFEHGTLEVEFSTGPAAGAPPRTQLALPAHVLQSARAQSVPGAAGASQRAASSAPGAAAGRSRLECIVRVSWSRDHDPHVDWSHLRASFARLARVAQLVGMPGGGCGCYLEYEEPRGVPLLLAALRAGPDTVAGLPLHARTDPAAVAEAAAALGIPGAPPAPAPPPAGAPQLPLPLEEMKGCFRCFCNPAGSPVPAPAPVAPVKLEPVEVKLEPGLPPALYPAPAPGPGAPVLPPHLGPLLPPAPAPAAALQPPPALVADLARAQADVARLTAELETAKADLARNLAFIAKQAMDLDEQRTRARVLEEQLQAAQAASGQREADAAARLAAADGRAAAAEAEVGRMRHDLAQNYVPLQKYEHVKKVYFEEKEKREHAEALLGAAGRAPR